jgi:hypothetical protein
MAFTEPQLPVTTDEELALNGGYHYTTDVDVEDYMTIGDIKEITADDINEALKSLPEGDRSAAQQFARILKTTGGAAALVALLAACGPANAPVDSEPTDAPESSETATPEEVFTAESLALPDTLTPEETGTKFIQGLSAWQMAGATPENANAWFLSPDPQQFVRDLVRKNTNIFTQAVLIPDWDTPEHQDLRDFVGSVEPGQESGWSRVIIANLTNYFQTYESGNPIDVKPANREERVDSSELIQPIEAGFIVDTHVTTIIETDNRVSTWDPEILTTNGSQSTFRQTFQNIEGSSRLSAIQVRSGN